MRVIVQRVQSARVEVDGRVTGAIGPGLLVLAGFENGDDDTGLAWMSSKLTRMRIFPDADGVMNLSAAELGRPVLVVSQFTLGADTSRGNRPGFSAAAAPETGERLYHHFSARLRALGISVANGEFGADMDVELVNQGPVTIWLDSADRA